MSPSHGEHSNTNDQVMTFTPNRKVDDRSLGHCRLEAENVLKMKDQRIVVTAPTS